MLMVLLGSESSWLLCVAVVGGMAFLGQLGHMAFKYFRPRSYADSELQVAMQFIAVFATLNSLLLAFTAVSVWDGYKSADSSALNEATAIAMLGRDLGSYKGSQEKLAARAREELRDYTRCVLDEEWRMLAEGKSYPPCLDKLNEVFFGVAEIDPKTIRGRVILGEIWARLNEVSRYRRERLQASRAGVPSVLWFTVVLSTFLTLGAAFLLPRTAFGRMMILMLSLSYGAVFFFVVDMERPFRGPDRIRPDALERVHRNMSRFDDLRKEKGRDN